MNTQDKFGISKRQGIVLFVQMLLTVLLLFISIYLLIFSIANQLGGWMITSYSLITIAVISIICYGIVGFKKGNIAYQLAIVPFLGAILVNVMLPGRSAFQIALLAILLALTFAFLIKQEDKKFSYIVALLMVVISLTFSIYSSITANAQFFGSLSENWITHLAMYLSIFVPTIMSTTLAATYDVRVSKASQDK